MKNHKTTYWVYGAWEADKEIDALNNKSKEGWQVVKGGCFHTKFERNDNIQHRYQIDFNTNIKDKQRYIETFEEQGWKYINSTFNGWHYFKKVYDKSLPEEEYQIYTDNESYKEMLNKSIRLFNFITVALILADILFAYIYFKTPEVPVLIDIVLYTALILCMQMGAFIMRKKRDNREYQVKLPILQSMFTIWIAAMVAFYIWS